MKVEFNDEIKENWNNWLEIKGLAKRSIAEYNAYFLKYDGDLTQEALNRFIKQNNNSVARAFVNNWLMFIKMGGSFSEEVKEITRKLEVPKVTGRKKSRIPDVLEEDQIYLICEKFKNEREQLMVLLSFYGGLRVSELVGDYAIKPYSFNWNTWIRDPSKNGGLKIIGKGNKQRNVFVPQKVMARIYQWIKKEISTKQTREDKLFKIGERRWKTLLSEASTKAIGRHINPHLLRHSCGTWLRKNGWGLDEIQKYLGHENIATTTIYAHIDQEDIKEKFNQLV